jgi:hypothetical protein
LTFESLAAGNGATIILLLFKLHNVRAERSQRYSVSLLFFRDIGHRNVILKENKDYWKAVCSCILYGRMAESADIYL